MPRQPMGALYSLGGPPKGCWGHRPVRKVTEKVGLAGSRGTAEGKIRRQDGTDILWEQTEEAPDPV